MKNKLKIKLGVMVATFAAITSSAIAISFASDKDDKDFMFRGRRFSSKEDALKFLIQNKEEQNINIEDVKVLGNINKSYANSEIGLLNDKLLPLYDPNNIKFAWKNAGGGITPNYDSAKNTYYNEGRVRTKYDDGFNNLFLSELQAKNSMRQHRMDLDMGVYEQIPFILSNGLGYDHKNINPFNKTDLDNWKNNIKDNIAQLLMKNISYEMFGKTKPEYQVVFNKNDNGQNQNSVTFDLGKYLKNKDSNIKIEKQNGNTMDKISYSKRYDKYVHWTAPEKHIGDASIDDKDFTHSANWWISIDDNGIQKRFINSEVKDHGDWWFRWSKPKQLNITDSQLLDILNLKYSDFLKWNGDNSKYNLSEILNPQNEFQSSLKNINNSLTEETISSFLSSDKKIFRNKTLVEMYSKIIKDKIKNSLNSMYYESTHKISTTYNLDEYSLPRPNQMHAKSRYNGDIFHLTRVSYYVWGSDMNDYVTYNSKSSIKAKTSIDIGQSKTLNKLLELNSPSDQKTFSIKLNDTSNTLFDVTVGLDDEKGLVANKVELSEKNNKLTSGEFTLENSDEDSWNFMTKFYNDIQKAKEEKDNLEINIQNVFKDAFNDNNFDNNLIYIKSLQTKNIEMDIDFLLRLQITNLSNIYKKFYDQPSLLLTISNNIVDPKSLVLFDKKPKKNINLAKYRLTSISNYNPSLTEGLFEDESTYAFIDSKWKNLQNSDSNDLPAQILVAFDNNGQIVNAGGYKFDSEIIMEYNIKDQITPRRDYDHIFVGKNESDSIYNKINVVQKLSINNHSYYFDTFKNLKSYLLKYIEKNSEST